MTAADACDWHGIQGSRTDLKGTFLIVVDGTRQGNNRQGYIQRLIVMHFRVIPMPAVPFAGHLWHRLRNNNETGAYQYIANAV